MEKGPDYEPYLCTPQPEHGNNGALVAVFSLSFSNIFVEMIHQESSVDCDVFADVCRHECVSRVQKQSYKLVLQNPPLLSPFVVPVLGGSGQY